MDTHRRPHGHERADGDEMALARLLELDAEVLASHLTELTGWLADLLHPAPLRILDLGSGPGTGSLALADRFSSARVTAVDVSPRMLHRLRARAAAHGLADRIDTLHADLDGPWTAIGERGPYDLMWASAVLHHAADPHRALAQALENLRPGGLLAVTELDHFPHFLPEDTGLPEHTGLPEEAGLPEDTGIGRPGLEARLHAATDDQQPNDWTTQLRDAGFRVEDRRRFALRLQRAQAGPALNDYAHAWLSRLRSFATDTLGDHDLAAWDALLDPTRPDSLAHRDDLQVRTDRTTWIARRR